MPVQRDHQANASSECVHENMLQPISKTLMAQQIVSSPFENGPGWKAYTLQPKHMVNSIICSSRTLQVICDKSCDI